MFLCWLHEWLRLRRCPTSRRRQLQREGVRSEVMESFRLLTMTGGINLSATTFPSQIEVRDFHADGLNGIAERNSTAGTINTLLGNTDGKLNIAVNHSDVIDSSEAWKRARSIRLMLTLSGHRQTTSKSVASTKAAATTSSLPASPPEEVRKVERKWQESTVPVRQEYRGNTATDLMSIAAFPARSIKHRLIFTSPSFIAPLVSRKFISMNADSHCGWLSLRPSKSRRASGSSKSRHVVFPPHEYVVQLHALDEQFLRFLWPRHTNSNVVSLTDDWYPMEVLGRTSQEFSLEPEEGDFRDLVCRIRDKDPQAARELVLRYEGAIRRVVRIHMRDRRMRQLLDSTDVCQSVLASFFVRTALGQYELETPAQLINLLTTIARNKLTNQVHAMRAQKRDIGRSVTIEAENVVLVDRASSPSEQASAKEILQKVYEHLSPEERSLAEQRSLGRPWTELAEEFGATDVALRKRLTRALDRVLTELGIDDTDDQ